MLCINKCLVYNKMYKGGKIMEFEFSKRISGVKASAIREILKMMNDPQIISFGGGNPASETFPFEKLKEIIVEVLGCKEEEITMDTTFVDDLGADSLDVIQIIMGIEDAFDIEINNEDAEKITTVGDAVEQIKNAVN